MLITSWLNLLCADRTDPARAETPNRSDDRRRPRRDAFRSNPFRPPTRVRTPRGCCLRPSELRWLIRQRQV